MIKVKKKMKYLKYGSLILEKKQGFLVHLILENKVVKR
jgi:hypothetical protein